MLYEPVKVLESFEIVSSSSPGSSYILHLRHDDFELRFVQYVDPDEEEWQLDLRDWRQRAFLADSRHAEFPSSALAAYGDRLFQLDPLESELWASDILLALEPYLAAVRYALTATTHEARSARWVKAAYKIRMLQS